jgi:predicted RecB family nuclease
MEITEILNNCSYPQSRNNLGLSEIGNPCRRYLWLRNRGHRVNPISARTHRIFQLGDSIESDLISDLEDVGFLITDKQKQYHIQFGSQIVYGHIDSEIQYDGTPHILEIKSANDNNFRSLLKKQYRVWNSAYYAQIQAYMHASDIVHALIIVYNKNTSELYSEVIDYNPEYTKTLIKFVTNSITADIPQTFCGDKTAAYCDFRKICYPDTENEN